MDDPLFSILVPIYNKEAVLSRCLDSLINQTYPNLEIILINDGSGDGTREICENYVAQDSRIKVIHQSNAGVSEARNAGLNIASGDYISSVDPDDYVEPNMYQVLASRIAENTTDIVKLNALKNSETLLGATHLKGLYEGDTMTNKVVLPMIGSKKYGGDFLMGVPWLYIFSRQLIEDNGIRFNKDLHRCEDRLFTVTAMLSANSINIIDDALYHYEVDSASLSNRYDPERWNQELLYLSELKEEYSNKLYPKQLNEANERTKSDYVFRAIISIDNAFFSVNRNSFCSKYKFVNSVVNNQYVRASVKQLDKEKLDMKQEILFFCVKHHLPFLLSVFNTILRIKNKK